MVIIHAADTLIQTNYLNIDIIYGSEFLVKQLCNLQYKDIAGNLDTIEFLLYNSLSFKINKRPIFLACCWNLPVFARFVYSCQNKCLIFVYKQSFWQHATHILKIIVKTSLKVTLMSSFYIFTKNHMTHL